MICEEKAWDCLNLLLEYGQFEIIDFDRLTPEKDCTDCRVIYLMNDTVESFLIFKNARYTGSYVEDYEDEIESHLDQKNGALCIYQGDSHLMLFFDALELESHDYDYSGIGHFWIKGYEDLRNLEFQIAIIRDKYDYLGSEYCNELEKKIASLKNFPPLNYLFYPAVPEKYLTPMEHPWEVTDQALSFMESICRHVGDEKLLRIVKQYGRKQTKRMAKKLARCLRHTTHKAVPDRIYELINQAASVYPKRSYGEKADEYLEEKLKEARQLCQELTKQHQTARVYREEPFVYDCDDISFQVRVMVLRDGWWKRKIRFLW